MDKRYVLIQVHEVIYNSQLTAEELCALLELEVNDLVKKFPRKLVENAEKFGVFNQDEDLDRPVLVDASEDV